MPILPPEIEISPEEIFALGEMPPWGVAHVRSRQEKVLARHLHLNGIPFYLPTTNEPRRDRAVSSRIPLFPGYVFHRASAGQRPLLLRSNVVANLIEVDDQERLGLELGQIRNLQLSGAMMRPFRDLVVGEPVRVTEGVFAGYTGVVVRQRGSASLIVQVTLIRQAIMVELDRQFLQRVRRDG